MDHVWVKDCKTPEEIEERKKEYKSYRNAFEALQKVLLSKYPPEYKPDYSEAGWEGRVAHHLGKQEAYRQILNLIKMGD